MTTLKKRVKKRSKTKPKIKNIERRLSSFLKRRCPEGKLHCCVVSRDCWWVVYITLPKGNGMSARSAEELTSKLHSFAGTMGARQSLDICPLLPSRANDKEHSVRSEFWYAVKPERFAKDFKRCFHLSQ
ncbi:MAG: hypothetical protein WDZ88_03425 [Candidatus Paceibacterota bacterium]